MIATPPAIHFTVPRPAPAPAVNLQRVIDVLVEMESAGNWDHRGGALQFTPQVWAEETSLPFRLARDRATAEGIATVRLSRFCSICFRRGLRPSPEVLIGAWHHGLFGALWRIRHHRPSDYMIRGSNLYHR